MFPSENQAFFQEMDKREIEIIDATDIVSWEEVSRVLRTAHSSNVAKGIVLPYPHLPPEQLREKVVDRGGRLFVAKAGDRIIGTGAIALIDKKLWCGKGKYAYSFLDSVLPEYAGKGIYRRIAEAQEQYALNNGVNRIFLDTDERNLRIQEISRRNGYKLVDYRVRGDHNSVVMVKWLSGCPYSDASIWVRYRAIRLKRIFSHLVYGK